MKISDLKDGLSKVDLEATVSNVEESKQVMTKFGTQIKLTNVMIEDSSGSAKLTLWGDKVTVKKGQKIKIIGGFSKEFRGEMQVSLGRGGKLEIV